MRGQKCLLEEKRMKSENITEKANEPGIIDYD